MNEYIMISWAYFTKIWGYKGENDESNTSDLPVLGFSNLEVYFSALKSHFSADMPVFSWWLR